MATIVVSRRSMYGRYKKKRSMYRQDKSRYWKENWYIDFRVNFRQAFDSVTKIGQRCEKEQIVSLSGVTRARTDSTAEMYASFPAWP